MTVIIRDARASDLPAVVAIERVSFSDPWTVGMFTTHLPPRVGAQFLVAERSGDTVGFALSQTVMDESELLNIAVDPATRKTGVGAELLDAMMVRCTKAGAASMWLEVRASNSSARRLYETRGFVSAGLRKRYYQSPREDAIVLRADLGLEVRNESVTEPVRGLAADRDERILSTASHLPRQEIK
ncbi:MAG: ribosomal protein S18-alanine N-acetyltransferase [Gemmatimonadaceae bacterium]